MPEALLQKDCEPTGRRSEVVITGGRRVFVELGHPQERCDLSGHWRCRLLYALFGAGLGMIRAVYGEIFVIGTV